MPLTAPAALMVRPGGKSAAAKVKGGMALPPQPKYAENAVLTAPGMSPLASCGETEMGTDGPADVVHPMESGRDQLPLTGLVNTSVAVPDQVSDVGWK